MFDLQALRRTFSIAALLAAISGPAAASAEDASPFGPRAFTIDEIASDLAYGYCPLFIAGQFGLDAPALAERGFGSKVETAPDQRFGEISMVTAERTDGRIAFGGASGKACVLVIDGPQREAALTAMRDRMEWTGLAFEKTDNTDPAIPGVTVETFKAPTDGQFLYVQLVQVGSTNPLVSAVIYGKAE
jgi:hypothetical protein